MTIKSPGRTTRQSILSARSVGRNLELTLACGHVVVRGHDRHPISLTVFCGHCSAEWMDRMTRLIDGRESLAHLGDDSNPPPRS